MAVIVIAAVEQKKFITLFVSLSLPPSPTIAYTYAPTNITDHNNGSKVGLYTHSQQRVEVVSIKYWSPHTKHPKCVIINNNHQIDHW